MYSCPYAPNGCPALRGPVKQVACLWPSISSESVYGPRVSTAAALRSRGGAPSVVLCLRSNLQSLRSCDLQCVTAAARRAFPGGVGCALQPARPDAIALVFADCTSADIEPQPESTAKHTPVAAAPRTLTIRRLHLAADRALRSTVHERSTAAASSFRAASRRQLAIGRSHFGVGMIRGFARARSSRKGPRQCGDLPARCRARTRRADSYILDRCS